MEREVAWKKYDEAASAEVEALAADYIDFISDNKTERECAAAAIAAAEDAGYDSLADCIAAGTPVGPGSKLWACAQGKAVILVHVGAAPISEGMNILGAHIDSPRLDIKQNPLYEANDFALLDTHYYGGIKNYQWTALPLALHGVVATTDGEVIEVNIGDDPADPVFCVTDLLPHLGSQQMDKKGAKVVEGEDLDVLVGNRPLLSTADSSDSKEAESTETPKDPVKAHVLALLADKYGISEEDFLSAELEVVPAGRARDLGFDRSMVIGYGQDDRVCAYTSLVAQLALGDDVPAAPLSACSWTRRRSAAWAPRAWPRCSSRTPSPRSWRLPARAAHFACAAPSPARACCPRTCPPASTRPTQASSRRRTPPTWGAASCSTSTPAPVARADRTTPRPSTSRWCAASWTTRA